MKVKIIKCSKPHWWYIDCIGNVYEVESFNEEDYKVIDPMYFFLLYKSDCQIIEEPKQNNMKKKVYIKVESEQEFNALMKYYERNGWRWYGGCFPTLCHYEGFKDTLIEYKDGFQYINIREEDYDTIIPFSHLAAIEGIEIQPEPVEFLTSNLTVTVFDYGVRILDQGRVVMVSFQELEKINEHVKEYQSKL